MNVEPSLFTHWPTIRAVFARAQASSIHCTIATVDGAGHPHTTPIGTLFLRDDCSGYFFDRYSRRLAANIDANANVCVMAVDASKLFWLRALLFARFASPPGVRLYGTAGPSRHATADELAHVHARVRGTRWLRGNRQLWSDFDQVRDLHFATFRPVTYPVMMEHLWR